MEKRIADIEAVREEAQSLVARLAPKSAGATLITLTGELGAGKTTFTQEVARALGVTEQVTSPTFVLEKIYELPSQDSFSKLVHIDAYRLNGGAELAALGFDSLAADAKNLIIIEWPERIADALPVPDISITLVPEPNGSRTMTYA